MSDDNPIVSIVTPTYNHERYIARCLASTIAQTDPRWEQIVVDDGSDDGTEAIIRAIDDPRIRYVRRDHLGIMHLADAYNIALGMSRGAFIAVLEGDDFWPSQKIERQLPMFDDPQIVLSWGRGIGTDEFGEPQRTYPRSRVIDSLQGATAGETLRALLARNFIPACSVMLRRESLMSIGGFQQPEGMPTTDYPTWIEMCRAGPFSCTNQVLAYHRKHDRQVSFQMKQEMIFVLDCGARLVERLSPDERQTLGVSIDEVHQVERNRHAFMDYASGREALARGNHPAARRLFRRALQRGTMATGLKASIGLGCSYLGVDLEGVASVAN